MLHKAYAFDWNAFERELLPVLLGALRTGEPGGLLAFIEAGGDRLTDLTTEEPLDGGWRHGIDAVDVQALGDLALTAYYDIQAEAGLGHAWRRVAPSLPEDIQRALLGAQLGEGDGTFDPGRLGSYFQDKEQARRSLAALRGVEAADTAGYGKDFAQFLDLLGRCERAGLGLYVTF